MTEKEKDPSEKINALNVHDLVEKLSSANERAVNWMDVSVALTEKIDMQNEELERLRPLAKRLDEALQQVNYYRTRYEGFRTKVSEASAMREDKALEQVRYVVQEESCFAIPYLEK